MEDNKNPDALFYSMGLGGLFLASCFFKETREAYFMKDYLKTFMLGFGTYFTGTLGLGSIAIQIAILKDEKRLLEEEKRYREDNTLKL